jgi:hypothetical protein
VDELLRSGDPLPSSLVSPLQPAIESVVGTLDNEAFKKPSLFTRLLPGSLGMSRFIDDEEAEEEAS